MGQFIIVYGADRGEAAALFEEAIPVMETVTGHARCEQFANGSARIAKFARESAPFCGIVTTQTGEWVCGAGTLFYRNSAEARALQLLLGDATPATLEQCAKRAEGIFAIAAGFSTGSLAIVTDRLGTLHVYKANIGGCVVLSTSSLALAALNDARWDMEACREFLCTGTVFGSRSLFVGIEKLPPAVVCRFVDGVETRIRYWSPAAASMGTGATGSVGDLAEALGSVARDIGCGYERLAVDLTGGMDSRAILGAMMSSRLSFNCVVNGRDTDPDVLASKKIAEVFSLRHIHQRPPEDGDEGWWHRVKRAILLCDGEFNASLYANTYAAHRSLAGEHDASVNGSNGEICKGYWWELLFPFTGQKGHFDARKIASKRFAVDATMVSVLDTSFEESLTDHFAGIVRDADHGFEELPNTSRLDNIYLTLRMQRWQGRIASATSRLWPCVSPFMWSRPMEIALSTPARLRLRNRLSRQLIYHFNPTLARLPLAQGYPAVPIRARTFHLFAPMVTEFASKGVGKMENWFQRSGFQGTSGKLMGRSFPDLEELQSAFLLNSMLTGALYRRECFTTALGKAPLEYKGRILTLELTARAVKDARQHATPRIHP